MQITRSMNGLRGMDCDIATGENCTPQDYEEFYGATPGSVSGGAPATTGGGSWLDSPFWQSLFGAGAQVGVAASGGGGAGTVPTGTKKPVMSTKILGMDMMTLLLLGGGGVAAYFLLKR